MIHETKEGSGKDKLRDHGTDDITVADEEIEEIEILSNNTFSDRITRIMEKFAGTNVGQMMIKKTDRILKVVEETAKWSLPQNDAVTQLERPLPWIFFLPLIVCLRVIRIWLSVVFIIVGSQPVTPHSMVYYLQTKRRHLRAIRVQGLKQLRCQEIESTVMYNSTKKETLIGRLRNLLSSAICKPGQHRDISVRRVFKQDGKNVENLSERSSKRPRDDDSAIQNLTFCEMLDKFANEDSDNDSDFVPEEDEDDSSTSHYTSSSAEEIEKAVLEESTVNKNEIIKSQKDIKEKEANTKQIQKNGETEHQSKSKPVEETKIEYYNIADSDNEQMHTPKETLDMNGATESGYYTHELSSATTEVAPPSSLNTPKTAIDYLAAPQADESNKKSTPGHESAATLKPSLTGVTDTGSLQDFHSIFHPAPIVKGPVSEAKTSTSKKAVNNVDASSVTLDNLAAHNQRKTSNHSGHNKHYHHYNAKNRSKNRR